MEGVKDCRFRIMNLRQDAGETQEELAAALGLDPKKGGRDKINNWENGRSRIDIDNLAAIASHYHVATDWLLGLSDIWEPDDKARFVCEYTGLDPYAVGTLKYDGQDHSELSSFIASSSDVVAALSDLRAEADNLRNIITDVGAADLLNSVHSDVQEGFDLSHAIEKRVELSRASKELNYCYFRVFEVFRRYIDDEFEYRFLDHAAETLGDAILSAEIDSLGEE